MAGEVIAVDNITIKYGDFVAVNNVSFHVPEGEIFGLLGPNGSGKTTLIKTLCGLITPAAGGAAILGLNVSRQPDEIKEQIGYMSQKFSLYEYLTVEENLDFYASAYGLKGDYLDRRKAELIELVGIGKFLNRRASQLSGGWRQRLALICTLIHEPQIVFLDEPTAGIDPVARRELWDIIFKFAGAGVTFFVTTHYMDEAERCGRIGYLYLSELIACGTPEELKALKEVSPRGTMRLEVNCPSTSAARNIIQQLDYVRESTIFGQSIHVLMETTRSPEQLVRELAAHGFANVQVAPIEPSLEDVFVTLTSHLARNSESVRV